MSYYYYYYYYYYYHYYGLMQTRSLYLTGIWVSAALRCARRNSDPVAATPRIIRTYIYPFKSTSL
jgi:hypothetical protein